MPRSYRQLELDERRTIFRRLDAKLPVAAIASRLGRHRSTIHREIRRNPFHDERLYAGYFPLIADDLARERRQRRWKLSRHANLRRHVVEKLRACWSPQQIAGRLQLDAPDGVSVCHKTIYRYVHGPEGRAQDLHRHLPKARRRRQPRHGRKPRPSSVPPTAPSSSGRPRSTIAGLLVTGKPIC
jgi:IS30 family transposase